jgi:hypothetical protein
VHAFYAQPAAVGGVIGAKTGAVTVEIRAVGEALERALHRIDNYLSRHRLLVSADPDAEHEGTGLHRAGDVARREAALSELAREPTRTRYLAAAGVDGLLTCAKRPLPWPATARRRSRFLESARDGAHERVCRTIARPQIGRSPSRRTQPCTDQRPRRRPESREVVKQHVGFRWRTRRSGHCRFAGKTDVAMSSTDRSAYGAHPG